MNALDQANHLLERGDLQQAEKLYREILTREADHGGALWGLARVALLANQPEAAISLLARAARSLPEESGLLLQLGDALDRCRRYEEASSAYRLAARVAPQFAHVRYRLATHYLGTGDSDNAERELRAALALQGDYGPAWLAMTRLQGFAVDAPEIAAMESALQGSATSDGNAMALHYALGKVRDELDERPAAFAHWQAANELDLRRADFSVADMSAYFDSLKSVFNAATLRRVNSAAAPGLTPVFILGQPRSGSTLLESMLACHSQVATAGEVSFLGSEIAEAMFTATGRYFPEACAELSPAGLEQLATLYLERLQHCAPGFRWIIDKLPANYQSVGLIHMLMPHARVIHLRRDPMDVGFSIFRNHFDVAEPYFATLPEIGAYHCEYETVMQHWREQLPGFMHELDYEALVAEPEAELRAILDFCGLPWQTACLDYHRSGRHVNTLSQLQVREPLQTNRVATWRRYETQLAPLQNLLRQWL